MAADGQSTVAGTIVRTKCRKIERLPDGSLFGAAGDAAQGYALRDWLAKSEDERGPYPELKDVSALVLRKDGSVVMYDTMSRGYPDPLELPVAFGSGEQYAIGAMDAGATPEEAVRISSKRDPDTGGEIQVERL